MRIALHQPDIAGNVGTILRLAACMGVAVEVISGRIPMERPCPGARGDGLCRRGRRAAPCRLGGVPRGGAGPHRAATTTGAIPLGPRDLSTPGTRCCSAARATACPRRCTRRRTCACGCRWAGFRSLNVAVACAMVLGEALRQTGQLPDHGQGAGAGGTGSAATGTVSPSSRQPVGR
ncbi:tRNA (cytidine(34)-2'-O)-methyltransferase [Sphingomonas sp. MMS24-JH45]